MHTNKTNQSRKELMMHKKNIFITVNIDFKAHVLIIAFLNILK